MAKKRATIPKEVAAKVLFESDRSCCVCRKEKQRIQIHHIDEDPSNNAHDNLAVLCFDCHWETQIRGGFDRKLDADQVRLYRDDWVSQVKTKRLNPRQNEELRAPGEPGEKSHIEYEVVQDSVVSYSNSEVLRNAGYFVGSAMVFLVLLLSVVSAALYFREPILMFFAMPVLVIGGIYLNKYRLFIKMLFLPQSEEVDRYVNGKYVHKGNDGNYTVYEKLARCNFPKCNGSVRIFQSPPRERYKHGVIGQCSLEPNLHTFTVDFNGVGYFKDMDFRPLPQQSR